MVSVEFKAVSRSSSTVRPLTELLVKYFPLLTESVALHDRGRHDVRMKI